MATRRRKPLGETSDDYIPSDLPLSLDETEMENTDDPRRRLSFFDYLDSLTELERNERLLYIYRLEPAIRNPAGTGSYIEKVSVPIDEDYLVTHHGGGKYLLWLKTTEKPSRTDRKHTFVAAGNPKIPEGTTIIDGRTGQPVATMQPGAADGGANTAIKDVLHMLERVLENKDKPDDLSAEILKKSLMDAQDILAAAAKKTAGSMSGNPMVDKLLEGMLTNLGQPQKPVDAMEALRTQMEIWKTFQQMTGGGEEKRPRGDDFLERAKGIAELLKTDSDGTLRGILFGSEEREPTGLGASLFRVAETILTKRPDIIDSAANLLGRLSGPAQAPGAPTLQQQPALAGVPQQVQQQMPQQQPVQQQSQEEYLINGLLGVVVNGFNGGHSGAVVATSMRVTHPRETESFVQYLKLPDEAIIGWLQSQAVIAPIMSDPRFAEFYEDFKTELLDPTPLDAGDEEEEQSSAAGA